MATSNPLAALLRMDPTNPPPAGVSGPPPAGMGPTGSIGATNAYASAQVSEPVPLVFNGTKTEFPEPHENIYGGRGGQDSVRNPVRKDDTQSPDAMLEAFAKADPKDQRRMALLLTLAGFAGKVKLEDVPEVAASMSLGETLDAYTELLKESVVRYTVQGVKSTPEQILKEGIRRGLPIGASWDGDLDTLDSTLGDLGVKVKGVAGEEEEEEEGPFSGTKSITSTSVNRDIMDPADAKALTRAMLQRELGRDPTEGEFEDFIGAIQHAQRVNPDRTTTTQSSTFAEGELVSQATTSNTRQGIGAEGIADLALQKARQNPNWAEWQAVGTYAPALFEALGATVAGR